MEHICFEVQLCIKIPIFKEKHVLDILIILCLMTSRRRHLEFLKNQNFDKNPKCSNVHIYSFHASKIQNLDKIQKPAKKQKSS